MLLKTKSPNNSHREISKEPVDSNLGSSIQDESVSLIRIPAFSIRELYSVINK